jgi:L-lactate dehydrogenase complex protein LldG
MARVKEQRSDLWTRMGQVAGLRGWKVCRTDGTEEALDYICRVASSQESRSAVRSQQGVFDHLPLDNALSSRGVRVTTMAQDDGVSREELRQKAASAGVSITGADYGVAETGSVVLIPRRGVARLVSLAPPVHVAVVRPEDVVESLDDVFLFRRLAYYEGDRNMGSYLNFITGPSRTADIEQKLVIGVHGPKEVHLVMLGPA